MSQDIALEPFGFNVIGPWSESSGLGRTTRELVRVLVGRGERVRVFNFDRGRPLPVPEASESEGFTFARAVTDLSAPVSIFMAPAHFLPTPALMIPAGFELAGKLNLAYVWWEINEFPDHWVAGARLFDALLTASDFVASVLRARISGVPVINMNHSLRIPGVAKPDRSKFGLPGNKLLIYCGFAPASDVDRKNPFAAIAAFKQAFPQSQDVAMVIKVSNIRSPAEKAVIQSLQQAIAHDPRFVLVTERLADEALFELYACCDIFISLHRSEGLGLILLEAMRLGKPVIATNWSGNLTFMRHSNSCLVGFDFIRTEPWSLYYGRRFIGGSPYWADADVNEAARWLAKLAHDAALRERMGEQALLDTLAFEHVAEQAAFCDDIRLLWEQRTLRPSINHSVMIRRLEQSTQSFKRRAWLRLILHRYDRLRQYWRI